uniref:Cadherin domain-containing protein n=1 Tax=Dicentrarchus labrax TaxID=13489 RepID=A0A8C4FC38_DICLA
MFEAAELNNPLHKDRANVIVVVLDRNDNAPRFSQIYLTEVPEDSPVGHTILQVTSTDYDTGPNAVINYFITDQSDDVPFNIDFTTGYITVERLLDREMQDHYILKVNANDSAWSISTDVTIVITDVNDNRPEFSDNLYSVILPETKDKEVFVLQVLATDEDLGQNSEILYVIKPPNEEFWVNASSGEIYTKQELDYETEGIYHLQIKAMDGGWVSKTGILNVTVVVMDVNDNPPVFSSSEYTTSVPENSEIGTNVIDVKAFDADSGANAQISYSLTAGYVDKFAIDSRNGTITTLDVFDFEREQIFDITIKASNIGGHTLFSLAHVVIQISDVNEFTPTFRKKEFNFSVFKNVPVGTRVGKVTATDDDQGSEGQVFYLMFGQNKYLGFEINKLSGEIYTTASLRKQGNSHIVLKVLAKNSGVITGMDIDETLVHISVIDTNDAPIFTSALYSANVTEDSPVGTSVITVSALDQDSILDWNRFFFSIENGNANFSFAVDPSSGVISVNSPLDRELWPFYNLTVTATDNGSPPATGTTVVIVTIDDVNDNAPKLTFTEAQVKENQPQGTIVARLNASDSDLPPNQGPFTYWLVNPSTGSAFSLTPNGVLFTTRTIDREQISVYRVLVAVRDAGMPLLSSTTMLHIKIVDENDNPSLPRNIFIEVKYFGSSFQGGMIGKVHPEDQDDSDITVTSHTRHTHTTNVKSPALDLANPAGETVSLTLSKINKFINILFNNGPDFLPEAFASRDPNHQYTYFIRSAC